MSKKRANRLRRKLAGRIKHWENTVGQKNEKAYKKPGSYK